MTLNRSIYRIGPGLWLLSIIITLPAIAGNTQPTEPTDQPAYWLARAGHSIRQIVDPDDPDYARLIRAQAFSLLARCADDLGDTDLYRSAIQTAAASAAEIADADLKNEARWSLAEAFAESGRFDEAKKTVDAITDPTARASARMTLAVTHARLGQQADYQRISAASQRALIDAHATSDRRLEGDHDPARLGPGEELVPVQGDQGLVRRDHVLALLDGPVDQGPRRAMTTDEFDDDLDLGVVHHLKGIGAQPDAAGITGARAGQIPGRGRHHPDPTPRTAGDLRAVAQQDVHGPAAHRTQSQQSHLGRF